MSANEAKIFAFMGASGSGKSTAVKQAIAKSRPPRLLIWDPQGEYRKFGRLVSNLSALRSALIKAGAGGPLKIVFAPSMAPALMAQQFDIVCQLAYLAGNLTLVAEELSDVTQPGWAPAGWSMVSRKGRHKGLTVYASRKDRQRSTNTSSATHRRCAPAA